MGIAALHPSYGESRWNDLWRQALVCLIAGIAAIAWAVHALLAERPRGAHHHRTE